MKAKGTCIRAVSSHFRWKAMNTSTRCAAMSSVTPYVRGLWSVPNTGYGAAPWARLHPGDPRRLPLDDWPLPRSVDWLDRMNQALTGAEIETLRRCAERDSPCGRGPWVEQIARHLGLEAALRARGRPPKKS